MIGTVPGVDAAALSICGTVIVLGAVNELGKGIQGFGHPLASIHATCGGQRPARTGPRRSLPHVDRFTR